MGEYFDLILSNRIYFVVALSIIGVIIFFIIKKMTKLFIYGFIILIAFLAYIYYSGDSDKTPVESIQKAVKKVK